VLRRYDIGGVTGSKAQSFWRSQNLKTKKTLNITLNAFDVWYHHLPYM
jgi:hypothetical protein